MNGVMNVLQSNLKYRMGTKTTLSKARVKIPEEVLGDEVPEVPEDAFEVLGNAFPEEILEDSCPEVVREDVFS